MFNYSTTQMPLDEQRIEALQYIVPNLQAVVDALKVGGFTPFRMSIDRRYSHNPVTTFDGSFFRSFGVGNATITFECAIAAPPLKEAIVRKAVPYAKQRYILRTQGSPYKWKYPETFKSDSDDEDEYKSDTEYTPLVTKGHRDWDDLTWNSRDGEVENDGWHPMDDSR